jgi:hypothetical protein
LGGSAGFRFRLDGTKFGDNLIMHRNLHTGAGIMLDLSNQRWKPLPGFADRKFHNGLLNDVQNRTIPWYRCQKEGDCFFLSVIVMWIVIPLRLTPGSRPPGNQGYRRPTGRDPKQNMGEPCRRPITSQTQTHPLGLGWKGQAP